jgi:hypothetical protein
MYKSPVAQSENYVAAIECPVFTGKSVLKARLTIGKRVRLHFIRHITSSNIPPG